MLSNWNTDSIRAVATFLASTVSSGNDVFTAEKVLAILTQLYSDEQYTSASQGRASNWSIGQYTLNIVILFPY